MHSPSNARKYGLSLGPLSPTQSLSHSIIGLLLFFFIFFFLTKYPVLSLCLSLFSFYGFVPLKSEYYAVCTNDRLNREWRQEGTVVEVNRIPKQ